VSRVTAYPANVSAEQSAARSHSVNVAVVLPPELLTQLAEAIADRIRGPWEAQNHRTGEGWLAPEAAARYLGVSRQRIYDLKSQGAIEPDGWDGRTPMYRRQSLDSYLRGNGGAP
jgi:Helix-turn-helix domain